MSSYSIPSINNKPPVVVDSGFYCDIRFDPDKDSPTYIGLHTTQGASTSDTGWKIYKLASSRIEYLYGSWDNRASLGW